MDLNEESKIRIDGYINAHMDAKTDERFPISLKGKKQLLDVYRLPTDILFYNIKNGRFAAEYCEKLKQEGGHLDPEKKADEDVIKNLLLGIKPDEVKRTYNDLKIRGQWNCGIITVDGYLIDGNRRKAIISKLHADTGSEVWKYMDVARLNGPITSVDLWALEAGIQLGKDEIVRYGPINEMLKIQEGKQAGLSEKEIVNALYGYDKEYEISDKIYRLKLVEEYLKFIGKPEQYSKANHIVEHFINLQNIIKNCETRDYDPDRIIKIKRATFQLIREGISHLDIRKINQIVELDLTDAISELESAGKDLRPQETTESKDQNFEKEVSEFVSEYDEPDLPSPTQTRFINATDILDVNKAEGKGITLLRRSEKYLKALAEYQGNELSDNESMDLIKKIDSHVKNIIKRFGGQHGA